jgi:hypothetical protein
MQSHGHKIVKCSCGEIMLQCRCMMENKPVEVIQDGCEECKERIDSERD